ncbi:ankyrin repeat domain-containing protein [Pseudoduganella aquatica]|uniref:Ankyrin repeat domain-containing protein n=1 Tax=Pseudoduganella aquatica TaxID=2660641 RepID=A0A7X4HFV9_9BURK|nr:ankyrin repeat domain-containing protein [Pseudoduganella aquatica]MYN10189.1 hypothetical protein [Pseudoduganella aquatica]
MAIGSENLAALLEQLGGPTESGLKYLLITGDLMAAFDSDEDWAELCQFASKVDEERGISARFEKQFRDGISPIGAMQDNYVLAALAACRIGLEKSEPLMVYAASNKHEFPGFVQDGLAEMSCMRVLHWGGWDVSAPHPETGMTALHLLAATRHAPGSNPRAIHWLLQRGANPSARNENGDTALAYLCGISVWGRAQLNSFVLLLLAGADPFDAANDGTTPLHHLKSRNESQPIQLRTQTIEAIETDINRTPGVFASGIAIRPEHRWQATLALAGIV